MSNSIRTLSDDDLARLLRLMSGADSVELKLTIPETQRNATISALGSTRSMRTSGRCISSTPQG